MCKQIRIGIIGCANIAKKYLIPAFQALSDSFFVVGVASRSVSRANEFKKLFNVAVFDSYDELIAHREIDAVYIPLPNGLHYQYVKEAIKNGKHVLVEKSIACTSLEVITLNRMAQENNLVLLENFQFRFHRQLKEIQQIISGGKIGDIRTIRSSFGFPPFEDKSNIRYQKKLGGGALLDAGAYPIKISTVLMGSKVDISSAKLFIDEDLDIDLWGAATIESIESVVCSQIAFGFDNYYQCSLEVWGATGKISAPRVFTAPPGFTAKILIEKQGAIRTIEVPPDNHFINMLEHFHSLITTEKSKTAEYEQNVLQSKLIEQVKEKAFG